ncbi:hypothetical protein [Streptomyces tirandamycinicus]|uniref:Uncharacterized protein n=1 Tax=Streptomyces tirandamycinicus TaxID=2174846 RepID=A0A2S1SNC7_9ACTN|nr:hypothetical protein [Streptomyces tirandamycinicus]AWI27909.1 hypothetical protein DDW44_03240 [Streptomyces tirandamycinicus]
MRDPEHIDDTSRSGLTTDDLAHPRTGGSPRGSGTEAGTGDRHPPTFPGEATALPGDGGEAPAAGRDRPAEPSGAEAPGTEEAADRESMPDRHDMDRDDTDPEAAERHGVERDAADRAAADRRAAPDGAAGEDRAPGTGPGPADPEPAGPGTADGRPAPDRGTPLIAGEDAESYRDRWQQIQANFVDDPRDSVRAADSLVADVIQSLAATFADHKQDLESQWSRGEDTETEGLRVALQRYRVFFNQLLDA